MALSPDFMLRIHVLEVEKVEKYNNNVITDIKNRDIQMILKPILLSL